MTAKLKESVETAQTVLGEDAQDRLAGLIEVFVALESGGIESHFSAQEMADLRAEAERPFEAAEPAEVRELFTRNGVTLNHEL